MMGSSKNDLLRETRILYGPVVRIIGAMFSWRMAASFEICPQLLGLVSLQNGHELSAATKKVFEDHDCKVEFCQNGSKQLDGRVLMADRGTVLK